MLRIGPKKRFLAFLLVASLFSCSKSTEETGTSPSDSASDPTEAKKKELGEGYKTIRAYKIGDNPDSLTQEDVDALVERMEALIEDLAGKDEAKKIELLAEVVEKYAPECRDAFRKYRNTAFRTECASNLKQIYVALIDYKMNFGKRRFFPRKAGEAFVAELCVSKVLLDPRILLCPATGRSNEGVDPEKNPERFTDYEGIDNGRGSPCSISTLRNQKKIPSTSIPLVWDKKGNHEGIRLVLFLDGHVASMSEEEFQEVMKNIRAE